MEGNLMLQRTHIVPIFLTSKWTIHIAVILDQLMKTPADHVRGSLAGDGEVFPDR